MPDKNARVTQSGWVFYDADCPLCVAGVRRIGGLFVRHGFVWEPLQGPGIAAKLEASQSDMPGEMKLLLADGRVVGGADAWASLFHSVRWLRPLAWLMQLPVLHGLSHTAYGYVTRNRYCIGKVCRISTSQPRRHRTIPFCELP